MYISKISISNFRNFKKNEVEFNDGVNVIIGHNNSGKTNLIKALSLVFDDKDTKRLDIDDFNKHISLADLKKEPPEITIAVIISQGKTQEDDDLVTISSWLTKLEEPYEALLTYKFFLPEKEKEKYLSAVNSISYIDKKALSKTLKIIQHDFIRLFVHKIWGGNIINRAIADSESLQKFDFQFLDAIRDVERDMLTGRNTLLRDVLDFFMDYDIKKEKTKSDDEKKELIKSKKQQFSDNSDKLIDELQGRMEEGKNHILSYAKDTGASFNKATPNFDGSISDIEMFSALRLIVEYETGIKIPATHNGLGYNNLIFMSLLLAKMQVNSDGNYLGSNAQVFISTHSTHITSAVSLDEIICLHNENGKTSFGYPSKVFPDDKSKKYVQRFLDATKSDMLFAQKVILVEGLAEQLLISIFAEYLGKYLEEHHIVVINVGGRYFNYFLHLFDDSEFAINKKVACLTDRDPTRKGKTEKEFKKCYPFEYNQDTANYDYKDNATDLIKQYKNHTNIRFFSQDENYGKTFEYDLILHNPKLELLITESMSNASEIIKLMQLESDKSITDYSVLISM